MSNEKMLYLGQATLAELRKILREWRTFAPQMGVFVLLPEAEREQVSTLQTACHAENVPLVGAIFPALVVNEEFQTHGLWLLRLDNMPAYALLGDLKNPEVNAATLIATAVGDHLTNSRDATLFMVFDAMIPNISSILDELYLQLHDRVGYAGVNAGSETFQAMPCLFDNEIVIGDGVLMMVLGNGHGAILEHGYKAPEQLITATSTEGNRIISIDWRPAFEVYREVILTQFGVEVTTENFYRYASNFPFGIVRADDEVLVRIPVALESDGSVFCVGEIPANAMLTLLQASLVDSTLTVRALLDGMAKLNGNLSGQDLLLFYCAGRRMFLGERAQSELAEVARLSHARQIAGALSLGEIGSSRLLGYPLFHNATLVGSMWGAAREP